MTETLHNLDHFPALYQSNLCYQVFAMGSINKLKHALKAAALDVAPFLTDTLSDIEYQDGLALLTSPPNDTVYNDFIAPTLRSTLAPLFESRNAVSVLEIGPGPKTVLASLPAGMRQKIRQYTAFEPNAIFAKSLEHQLEVTRDQVSALAGLEDAPHILRARYELNEVETLPKYDLVLFCHSMYGLSPKRDYIEQALNSLSDIGGELVVVFHRDGLSFDGLVCHRTASSPNSTIAMSDDEQTLDSFASFVAGISDSVVGPHVRSEWGALCRYHASHDPAQPGQLVFHAPDIMVAFNKHATALSKLTDRVPRATPPRLIKNREARNNFYAAMVTPTDVTQGQECVRWALKHKLNLTVIGGSHSGHCLQPNVVAIDMSAFKEVHIIDTNYSESEMTSKPHSLVMVGAGCSVGDIVRTTMAAGLTVPLGSRPSVGIGLPLQGGIGHLARQHGLACDSMVGAVLVSVQTGEVLCIGQVPAEYWPEDAMRPDNEDGLLWAVKGAGTNFGIVISLVFRACPAPKFLVREWSVPLKTDEEAVSLLTAFDHVAQSLAREFSADPCIYAEDDQLRLGVTTYESLNENISNEESTASHLIDLLGLPDRIKEVDCKGLFDTDMYMSSMNGGHASGKKSSFKRCVFLKSFRSYPVAKLLLEAMKFRPSSLCYLHLLQGGGAIRDVPETATAFGCRDWEYACVITGVWPREQANTEAERAAIDWVYNTVERLLPLSPGVYGADLGPDPRDRALATRAFGPNRPRLARLKRLMDPSNVLPYACPLPESTMEPKIIILLTGESGAGKDHCAEALSSLLEHHAPRLTKTLVRSISDVTKREYAVSAGADIDRLLNDRDYKEQHRPALTEFFEEQVARRPQLPQEHFLNVVYSAPGADVLFITGMRDEAPVATFAHLVPGSRMLEIRIEADEGTLRRRRGASHTVTNGEQENKVVAKWRPDIVFENNEAGPEGLTSFMKTNILPLLSSNHHRLADVVRTIPDFPSAGKQFRHVLGISHQPNGLAVCASLMRSQWPHDTSHFDVVVCCGIGGMPFATALAASIDVPLVIMREGGKLPPPVLSVRKLQSHISSHGGQVGKDTLEIERDVVGKGTNVLVVDDVLASGETLCAMLELLRLAGINMEDIFVQVVAEFPPHRGRARLLARGFGRIRVRSLLTYDHL